MAALPQVENLNGSAIHARARAMAERAFVRALKYSGPDGAEVPADDPSLPPRFHELVASALARMCGCRDGVPSTKHWVSDCAAAVA